MPSISKRKNENDQDDLKKIMMMMCIILDYMVMISSFNISYSICRHYEFQKKKK